MTANARTIPRPSTAARGAGAGANIGSSPLVAYRSRGVPYPDCASMPPGSRMVTTAERPTSLYARLEPRGERRAAIARGFRQRLDHDLHGIEALPAREHNLIVRC